eukprot:TRINITY_DN742_c3_g1_i1.p1 TRINITY_DN742_c3_g1~~TRINITY_DN742_c3_g1_i1.p1  ORF type:complete len:498 (-),score=107.27 TRINITY_DN742_c3_g1_i1:56-1441(-)
MRKVWVCAVLVNVALVVVFLYQATPPFTCPSCPVLVPCPLQQQQQQQQQCPQQLPCPECPECKVCERCAPCNCSSSRGYGELPPFTSMLERVAPRLEAYPLKPVPKEVVSEIYRELTPYLEYVPAPLKVVNRPEKYVIGPPECGRYPMFHTGLPWVEGPGKVYYLMTVNTELDLLEVLLYELEDVVDLFILCEATATSRGAPKPLFYERNKERFARFSRKIVHVVIDDSMMWNYIQSDAGDHKGAWFTIEEVTRDHLYKRYNELVPNPGPRDIVIYADVDEISRADVIRDLKSCEIKPELRGGKVSLNSVQTPGELLRKCYDWHHPDAALAAQPVGHGQIRNTGGSPPLLPANTGVHMTSYTRPEVFLSKYLGVAEGGLMPGSSDGRYIRDLSWLRYCILIDQRPWIRGDRCELNPNAWIPWVVAENPERYPHMQVRISDEEATRLRAKWDRCPDYYNKGG